MLGALQDAIDCLDMQTEGATQTQATNDKDVRSYSKSDLRIMAKLGDTTLTKYTKTAGVPVPGKGTKNHRYSTEETRKILQAVSDGTQDPKVKQRCKEALSELA